MGTIAFLALDVAMLDLAKATLAGPHDDIRLAQGLLGDAVETARRLQDSGVEVVISRGATAARIAAALPALSVVDISTSALDLITALHRARSRQAPIAVVAFPPMSNNAVEIGRMLGVEVSVHELATEAEIEARILRARAEGAGVIVGGYIAAQVAKALGVPFQPVEASASSILSAVDEAKRLVRARALEKEKASLLRAVLTFTDNGILAIDQAGLVTLLNPIAARLLRIGEDDFLGKPIRALWPKLGLDDVVATGKGEIGQIDRLFDQDIICNKIAISVGGATVGAVATFHDVRQIQQMEATVRRRILAAGHVATSRFEHILGDSPALRQAIALGTDFAATPATVLILGETGTGKELFAQGIHNASARRDRPFVAVNCAALPGQLLESELFGYVQGAFTGASQKGKPGLFELAHGGSIFLDEIAEMDLPTQGKLLRVLQEKRVMRLGSDQVIPVDARVIAATNKDLKKLVAEGRFREDLYYRLNVLQLRLPALRQRAEDIPLLARHFLRRAETRSGAHALSGAALRELARHSWPGNVRELQNVIARVSATLKETTVSGSLVARLIEDAGPAPIVAGLPGERERIGQALAQCGGRIADTAHALGISRSTLWRKMRRFKIA